MDSHTSPPPPAVVGVGADNKRPSSTSSSSRRRRRRHHHPTTTATRTRKPRQRHITELCELTDFDILDDDDDHDETEVTATTTTGKSDNNNTTTTTTTNRGTEEENEEGVEEGIDNRLINPMSDDDVGGPINNVDDDDDDDEAALRVALGYEEMDMPDSLVDDNNGDDMMMDGPRTSENDDNVGTTTITSTTTRTTTVQRPKSHRIAQRRRVTVGLAYTQDPFEITYRPGRFRLYHPPVQRQRWGQRQVVPRINWGDIFFDLFYVAAAYRTSDLLVDSPSGTGVLYFLGCFLSITQLWVNKTSYDARFVNSGDDLFHRMWEVGYLATLASCIIQIRPVSVMANTHTYEAMFDFAISLVVAQVLFLVRYIELYYFGRGQRDILKRLARTEGLVLCVGLLFQLTAAIIAGMDYFSSTDDGDDHNGGNNRWLASTTGDGSYTNITNSSNSSTSYGETVPDTNTVPIWLCLVVPVLVWAHRAVETTLLFPRDGYSHKKYIVPFNVNFVIHRDGEWTMLMYGESILSLLTVNIPEETSPYYLTFYFSLATVVLLHYLHFRSQPHDADDHVFRRSKDRSLIWKVFWYTYSASLIALGSAFTIFVQSFSYDLMSVVEDEEEEQHRRTRLLAGGSPNLAYPPEEMIQRAAYLFSASLALVFFSMDMMSLMHIGWKHSHQRCYSEKGQAANVAGIVLIVIRAGLIVFCATLGVWSGSNMEVLSGSGLAVTIIQLSLRRLGEKYLTARVGHTDDTKESVLTRKDDGEHQHNSFG